MKKLLLAAAVLVVTGTGFAYADVIADREALMKSFGKALGQLGPIAKGTSPFDAEAVKTALATLHDQTQKLDVDALFPKGSTSDKSEASPKIWDNFADFKSKADDLKKAAETAAASPATDVKGLQGQLGMIGKTCGACHETYRLKKD